MDLFANEKEINVDNKGKLDECSIAISSSEKKST